MTRSHILWVAAALVAIAPAALAKEGEGERPPKPVTVSGQVTKIDPSIPAFIITAKKGDRGTGTDKAIGVTPDTKVLIESDQTESVPGEGGSTKQRPKVVEGKLADLKVGQHVTVTCSADGRVAASILIRRAPAPRKGGEGDRAPSEPKPPRTGGEGDRG